MHRSLPGEENGEEHYFKLGVMKSKPSFSRKWGWLGVRSIGVGEGRGSLRLLPEHNEEPQRIVE